MPKFRNQHWHCPGIALQWGVIMCHRWKCLDWEKETDSRNCSPLHLCDLGKMAWSFGFLISKMLIIMPPPPLTELLWGPGEFRYVTIQRDWVYIKQGPCPLWLLHSPITVFVDLTQTEWHKYHNIEKQKVVECKTTFLAQINGKRLSSHLLP